MELGIPVGCNAGIVDPHSVDSMAFRSAVTKSVVVGVCLVCVGHVLQLHTRLLSDDAKHALGYPPDSLLNFTERSARYGYPAEEHRLLTQDGYILTVFRMAGTRRNGGAGAPPVILMHGLLQSADAWLDAGPGAGLAYLIADAGHDLWLGNVRGNYYSRDHVRLRPDTDPQFWDFSVDEIGLYDVPATIDYVLNYTKADKVNYVGFSQGAGTFFIMCSERPDYCDKVGVLVALAPAARHTNTKSLPYKVLAKTINSMEYVLNLCGIQEVFSKGALSQEFLAFFCQFHWISEFVCGTAEAMFDSFHPGSIRKETLKVLFGHFPAGTSTHNMARYGQSMNSDRFQKFDYGRSNNIKLYGSHEPPSYNLSAVSAPAVVLYGENDHLVDERDVSWLLERLPNVLEAVRVSDPLWNHLDVTYSHLTNHSIFPKINDYLLKYSNDCQFY
ncbi:Lipase 1 [Papilio machaon]|uniref:Lipase 1 n=1 Tax=Papilio machaon TaxID=76193 RepID=A0A0N1PFF0_PAPMA|nr:Lipase 1 [Papilio machaon]